MDYDPLVMSLACFFLAAKVENIPMKVEEIVKRTAGVDETTILELELILARTLQYKFHIAHPYDALYGFFLDVQGILFGEDTLVRLHKIYGRCIEKIKVYYLTRACLQHDPSFVSLAIFHKESADEGVDITRSCALLLLLDL